MKNIFLVLILCGSLHTYAKVEILYHNHDSIDHTFEVKIDNKIQKIQFEAYQRKKLIISGEANVAVIYSQCGKETVTSGDEISIRNACVSLLPPPPINIPKPLPRPINVPVSRPPKRNNQETADVFMMAEEQPEFKGGREQFIKFLKKNLNYPEEAKKIGREGKVFIQFIVNKDGSLSNIKIIKGIGAGCDEEAIRVIKLSSNQWNPGKQRGKPVRVRMALPIVFRNK